MTPPDTITVTVELEQEVFADRARLHVEVRGDSVISGGQALAKAREVRDLVDALGAIGIPQEAIHLMGVSAHVSSGLMGKSSSASYQLRIEVGALERVAEALGVITSRKNASMNYIEWQYGDQETIHDAMLIEAMSRAKERAELICREMGLSNQGVHSLADAFGDYRRMPMAGGMDYESAPMMRAASPRVTQEDLGLEVTHSTTKYLTLSVQFRVEGRR